MKMNYELITLTVGDSTFTNIKATDGEGNVTYIPADDGNSDYRAYLAYLAESEETA